MKNTSLSKWRYVGLAAAALVLIFVLYISFDATSGLAAYMEKNRTSDPSAVFDASLYYDDGLYVVVLYGEEILPDDPQPQKRLAAFEKSSFQKIDSRIWSGGVIYTMLASCVLAYYVYTISNNYARKYAKSTSIAVLTVYIIYIAGLGIFHAVFHVPFYLPDAGTFFTIVLGLLSVIGGNCALGLLLRKVRFKKIIAVAVIPVIFLMFLFSMAFEFGLNEPAQYESFDYVADIDPRFLDEEYYDMGYYDDEKGVLLFDGKEYPPEMVDNPDHLRGLARIGALLYELAFPYSGSSLSAVLQEYDGKLPLLLCLMYLIKSACWDLIPLALNKEENEQTDK